MRKYKAGLIAFGIYILLIAILAGFIFWSITNNQGDSGESGILLLGPASPWIWMIPRDLMGPISVFTCIFFNGILVGVLTQGITNIVRRYRKLANS